MTVTLPVAKYVNHQHILAIIHSELRRRPPPELPVRILDAGCGDGDLILFLTESLRLLLPDRRIELFGYDVHDHGGQLDRAFLDKTLLRLSAILPNEPWSERIHSIGERQAWPFANEFFDVVVSNQVVEHVRDVPLFLRQVAQALRPGGYSIHLFPLRNYILEGHLFIPLIHKFRSHDVRAAAVRFFSRLGFGPYRFVRRQPGHDISRFSEQAADYILHFTNYTTARDLLDAAKVVGLRASFRYTKEYYSSKVRRRFGLPLPALYRTNRSAFVDALAFAMLKYVASITLFLEKQQSYHGFALAELRQQKQV